jgi:hypothetical protein
VVAYKSSPNASVSVIELSRGGAIINGMHEVVHLLLGGRVGELGGRHWSGDSALNDTSIRFKDVCTHFGADVLGGSEVSTENVGIIWVGSVFVFVPYPFEPLIFTE